MQMTQHIGRVAELRRRRTENDSDDIRIRLDNTYRTDAQTEIPYQYRVSYADRRY